MQILACFAACLQVLCGLVAADVARQAWLAQAGALPMLERLTLGQAAARQAAAEAAASRTDGRGGDGKDIGGGGDGDGSTAMAPMSLSLRKQVSRGYRFFCCK